MPVNQWVNHGDVALSTDPDLVVGTPVESGQTLRLGGRCVVVLRQRT